MTDHDRAFEVLAEALAPRIARLLFPRDLDQHVEKPMSLDELADFTGISRSTLGEKAKQCLIPHYRAGRRLIFLASEVLAALRIPAVDENLGHLDQGERQ